MKKIGIVGGVAWQSTVDYYSELCRRSEEWHRKRNPSGSPSTLELSVESLDLAKAVSFLGSDRDENSWSQFDEYHRAALKRLEANGADIAIIASHTPHHRFEAIVQGVGIPVINIVEEVARECVRIGVLRVLLLGTDLTMKSAKFREEFARHGIDAAGPQDDAVRTETIELIADLQQSRSAGAEGRLRNIAKLSLETEVGGQAAVCLACTEMLLAFERMKQMLTFQCDDILFLNAAAIHIQAAFSRAVEHKQ